MKRLNQLMGCRWDAQQKSASEPEYYWMIGNADGLDILAKARYEAEQLGLVVGPGYGSGDVGILIEPDPRGGNRLVYAY